MSLLTRIQDDKIYFPRLSYLQEAVNEMNRILSGCEVIVPCYSKSGVTYGRLGQLFLYGNSLMVSVRWDFGQIMFYADIQEDHVSNLFISEKTAMLYVTMTHLIQARRETLNDYTTELLCSDLAMEFRPFAASDSSGRLPCAAIVSRVFPPVAHLGSMAWGCINDARNTISFPNFSSFREALSEMNELATQCRASIPTQRSRRPSVSVPMRCMTYTQKTPHCVSVLLNKILVLCV